APEPSMPWTKRLGCLDVSASAAGAADSNNAPPARAARSARGTARPTILASHVVRIRMRICGPLLVTYRHAGRGGAPARRAGGYDVRKVPLRESRANHLWGWARASDGREA